MDIVTKIRDRAKSNLKTIILPEYNDARVTQAARIIEKEGLAKVVLLSKEDIDAREKERYMQEFFQMHKAKGISMDQVQELFSDTLYYAAMMTREGKVDGIVAGASHTTPDMARASIRCLGVNERIGIVSSCFVMAVPNSAYGDNGTFIFADCGIVPEPNSRQLACIAVSAAEMGNKVLGFDPRIALLSYSTKGSAKGQNIDRIIEALGLIKEMAPELLADGELQLDAAIVPEVAAIKCPESPVGGKANILIFPNLESGNIGYKLVQRLAGARAIGPVFLGLNKPASDLSRGCLVEDIVDTVALIALMAK